MQKPHDVLECLQSISESLKEIAINTSPVKATVPEEVEAVPIGDKKKK